MKYYDDFQYCEPTEQPYPGEVANAAEALGHVAIDFADLEQQLASSISFLVGNTEAVGNIVTAELSFKQKLHVLASLFRAIRPGSELLDRMQELLGRLDNAEGLRNQIVHSVWRTDIDDLEGKRIVRHKYTAKMRHGLRKQQETLTPLQIRQVGYHFAYLAHCLDELLYMEFGSEYGED